MEGEEERGGEREGEGRERERGERGEIETILHIPIPTGLTNIRFLYISMSCGERSLLP